ncbi:MAG TPA: 4'-phosphopantetheinyl transferase superfamily protein [Bryobacteraceae bacterium]|jgi:4'-phosphopantetheinyl transferase|nr:4'-phosphopantetheinyl transferase superfamily protein [Bryobacteraceae bacterium]
MEVYWLEQTEADVPAGDNWLSASEAACLGRLRFAKRRADWRLGRWTAKCAVAAYLKMPGCPTALEIRAAPSGAPEVYVQSRPAEVTISISHRARRAACAVSPAGAALGCDVEIVEPHSDAFAADYFTAEEQSLVAQSGAGRHALLTMLWSGKESALKALGEGLRLDTRCVTVRPLDVQESSGEWIWRPMQADRTSGEVLHGWWQRAGDVVRTLVSRPVSGPPIWL